MLYLCFLLLVVISYIVCDVNYFIRTLFTVLTSRCGKKCHLQDTTTIYGICTFQDCDIFFKSIRLARLIREIDFARYHFYEKSGIYQRSRQLGITSLQGSTLTVSSEPVSLFVPYKINTQLVYWDERSLFFEHKVITVHDSRVRRFLVSRQYAIGSDKEMVKNLIQDFDGSSCPPMCPDYIKKWLQSMQLSSIELKKIV